ncbi:MAG: protease modulator HflC [Phycisphaerae bacterium]|nr:protease modulator HflC [Phycisphaerae bacterium]
MKKHIGIIILAMLVLLTLLLYTVAFTVDETRDIVLITKFGEVKRVYTGTQDAGLHFKWPAPVERVVRLDSRGHDLKSVYKQTSTQKQMQVMVSTFCTWRIKKPVRFIKAKKDITGVEASIRSLLGTQMTSVVGGYDMESLVNTNAKDMKLQEIAAKIKDGLEDKLLQEYGIEIMTLGIDALGLPESVSAAVIENMKKEREKEAQNYVSQGEAVATAIVGRAKAASNKILAFADRKAKDIETQGEAEAAKAYSKFEEDPQFGMFLRSMDTLRKTFKDRTTFVLDSDMIPALHWLRQKPSLDVYPSQVK